MANGRTYFGRPNYRFFSSDLAAFSPADSAFELDESDVYFSASSRSDSPEFRRQSRSGRKPSGSKRGDLVGERPRVAAKSSLPVNIPDWSKILRDEYRDCSRRRGDSLDNCFDAEEDHYEDNGVNRLPPHEFLARMRIGSFSVHEGVGRTLKGRDLSRMRNAVWARTGFQD
ncbi:hypothetical protein SAY86_017006 [Trapa natans]|uniref:Senescence regulator n=1 Tax=Trapa natans TaxID=22666 RepID=A0AAN7LPQ9_TRANT|nr:hypothetical protein SAY86_017006 [Trapa natans]